MGVFMVGRTIIHVDMDAFFAAVEVRDNPKLAGNPLIIGALPNERGVVSTCSYEARKFGVRSAMSIKEAYRRCPDGIYMHPNMSKYREASKAVHKIWNDYTDAVEYISLDEGYLDVTGSLQLIGSAHDMAVAIKARTKSEVGLTCSVGVGYSMAAAKLGSEEKKPDGLFEILTPEAFVDLIMDRNVRVLHGIGVKTAEKLAMAGVYTVRDIHKNHKLVVNMLDKNGIHIVNLANGVDNRAVTPWYESEAKSIGREHTFQEDISNFRYLEDVLVLLARELSIKLRFKKLYAFTITLKITYSNMKSITRSKSGEAVNRAEGIYKIAAALLNEIEEKPIRLIGISLDNLTEKVESQLTLESLSGLAAEERKEKLDDKLLALQRKYGTNIIKSGIELKAENRLRTNDAENI